MKKWFYNLIVLGMGLLISLLIAELVLHIKNPFLSRVRGSEILLPSNVKYEFKNVKIRGLDSHILHNKNSLGFRGPELPDDTSIFRIFCVGGSTTECFYLSDGKDWPALLFKNLKKAGKNIWVNNAGLDGHSSRGHLILLKNHLLKLKPDMVVFLTGCNDVAAAEINKYEQYHVNNKKRWLENSEIFNIWMSWKLNRNAKNMGLGHTPVDFREWPSADTVGWETESAHSIAKLENNLKQYLQRLRELAELCHKAGAVPVFVNQPSILGDFTDPVSGRYLGNILFQNHCALVYRKVLDGYNNTLNQLKNYEKNPPEIIIDAALKMESSSENYYDFFHYTNAGSMKMADIITREIINKKLIR